VIEAAKTLSGLAAKFLLAAALFAPGASAQQQATRVPKRLADDIIRISGDGAGSSHLFQITTTPDKSELIGVIDPLFPALALYRCSGRHGDHQADHSGRLADA
jgi:hypothetical protein